MLAMMLADAGFIIVAASFYYRAADVLVDFFFHFY